MNPNVLLTRRARPTLARVMALGGAIVALVAFGARSSQAAMHRSHATAAPTMTARALALHDAMRALWETHGEYTERAIVDFVGGLPETKLVVARLLQDQVDIGDAVKPYYGAKAGDELATLLKAHINDAVATLAAAKSGDAAATATAKAALYANGNQIASFLHAANPHHWPLSAMRMMMRVHLNQVIGLAVDQLEGHYAAAITLYDTYIHHILSGMADMLSNGIIQQFPARFR